jgi:predicted dienelactone hydrolase
MTVTTKFRMRRLFAVAVAALLIASCDFRGPEPTAALLNANAGPFTSATLAVPTSAGFGGGTIYYPTNVAGPFAVVSVSPGFTETAADLAGWGPRLASHGFVTIIFNTSDTGEFPAARSTEQRQALNYVISQSNNASSPIAGLVDGNRRGVMGHSMGGGASLISANADPTIRAAVGLAPFNFGSSFPNITVPTMIVACQNDSVAPVTQHASPMYNSIPATTRKSYISVANQNHFCANAPTGANGEVGRFVVAWMKRMLDSDTRYDPWVCGASKPAVDANLNEVRSSCPF